MPRSADSRRIATVETRLSATSSTFADPETHVAVALPLRQLAEAFFRSLEEGPVRRATLGLDPKVERHMRSVVVEQGAPDVERCVALALGGRVLGGTRPLRAVTPVEDPEDEPISEALLLARAQSDAWLVEHGMKEEG
jgi:hypothetical protein